jgi:hypothetical protein
MFGLIAAAACLLQDDVTDLKPGLRIERSTVFNPGDVLAPVDDAGYQNAAVVVSGDGVVVDFRGAVLRGSPAETDPDKRSGLGILVTGQNVTIKNAVVRGYKVGLLARRAKGLKLIDCDFSYNWKQRLLSDAEKEDLADWMSYHQNDKDEWLRFGAAVYLRDCDEVEIRGVRATGGQCGLMMTECDNGLVWNCDFSFLSAVGLGMYRSSSNRIMHNKLDWCVRGYSHGVYNRGQDSTGILIYEQSNANLFAYNSATHGGDGFFLWAGQTTMDTGEGGCNDNVLFGNDFSHSPANAIEATFSRNVFANNLLLDCWHGVWGGYSFDTLIVGNVFGFNGEAIAIEHGQYNRILGNTFRRDTVGVMLWQSTNPPPADWGYPKFRDVRNVGTVVRGNAMSDLAGPAFELGHGAKVTVAGNAVNGANPMLAFTGAQQGTLIEGNAFVGPLGTVPTEGVTVRENAVTGGGQPPEPFVTRGGGAIPAREPSGQAYLDLWQTAWSPWAHKGKMSADNEVDELLRRYGPERLEGGQDPFIPVGALRGRRYIIVDEWGPFDFRRPILWPRSKPDADRKMDFEFLGPAGKASLVKAEGMALVAVDGEGIGRERADRLEFRPGQTLTFQLALDAVLTGVQMLYVGAETTDARGVVTPAGKPVDFGWSRERLPIQWKVAWYAWDKDVSDPRTQTAAFEAALQGTPLATRQASELDFATGGSPADGVPANHFATTAEGTFEVPEGEYTVSVTTDDGCRVWLDGKLIIDEWKYQGPTQYTADVRLTKGRHTLRVRHFEIDGYTALKVKVERKRA